MPISLRPDRGDVPQPGDPAFDALLSRALRPEDAVAALRPVVEGFAALYAVEIPSRPTAQAGAMAAFRGLVVRAEVPGQAPGHGRSPAGAHRAGRRVRSRLTSLRLAAAGAVVALAAATAVAGYLGALPAPAQQLAHTVFDAPPTTLGAGTPAATPSAAPSAAYGLCRAYERVHGDPVTLRRLAKLAGRTDRVASYCAHLIHPGTPATSQPAGGQHPAQPTQGAQGGQSDRGSQGDQGSQSSHSAQRGHSGKGSSQGNSDQGGSQSNSGQGGSQGGGQGGQGSQNGNNG